MRALSSATRTFMVASDRNAVEQAIDRPEEDRLVDDGLGDVVVEAMREVLLAVAAHGVRGECDHREMSEVWISADVGQYLDAVHAGKRDVEEHDVRPPGGGRRGPAARWGRGVAGCCVLAGIRNGGSYAFDIVRVLAKAGELVTSEGTIYPLLARLRRDGLVTTDWRESDSGPPRRYYRITNDGIHALEAFVADWTMFREAVERLLTGRNEGGGSGGN